MYFWGFPEPRTYGEEYKDCRNPMKHKMERDRILGWKGNMATQWAANQAYALATQPGTVRAALWQRDRARAEHVTEYLDSLLNDIAEKHQPSLTRFSAAQLVPAVAPGAAPLCCLIGPRQ